MDTSSLLIIIGAVTACLLLAVLWLFTRNQHLQQQLDQQQQNQKQGVADLHTTISGLVHQVEEGQSRSVAMSRHVQQLQSSVEQLENQLREVKQQDPAMRLYHRGADLVKQGASIEEVMQACDLPRAEAELLFSMHAPAGKP